MILAATLVTACSAGTGDATTTTTRGLPASASTPPDSASTDRPAPPPTTSVADHTTTTTTQTSTTPTTIPWDGPCGRPVAAPGTYEHVIWIWMENKDRSAIFDSAKAPFLHSLAEACGTASNYVDHGIRPSLPNYIAATSGSTHDVHDDGDPQQHKLDVDNIFRQVRAIGKTAKSYEEAMPSNCSLQSTDRYAVKHNPATYFVGGDDRNACENDDVPFDRFDADLAGDLPAFSMITPDMCNDMHDCPVSKGDAWTEEIVTRIISSPTYRQGFTALFIVFDESEGGGTLPFVAVAPSIVPGTVADIQLDHYALLAFTEDALGITDHLGKAANAPSLANAFAL